MGVEEWCITSEFMDILHDVKNEKVEMEKIFVSKADDRLMNDLEFEVRLDGKGEVIFSPEKKGHPDKGITFSRARDSLYELRDNDATITRFECPKRRFLLPSEVPVKNLTSVDVTNVFDPQTRLVYGDSEGGLYVVRDSRGSLEKIVSLPDAHASHVTKAKFFPNGHGFLSSSIDMRLKIWDSSNGTLLRTFKGHTRSVNDFSMIDRGRNFVSGSSDGSLKLWECSTARCIHSFSCNDGIDCLSLASHSGNSPENVLDHSNEYGTQGKAVLAGHDSGSISYLDLFSRNKILEIPSKGRASCVSISMDNCNDSNYLIAGHSDGNLVSWDVRNISEPIDTLQVNEHDSITKIFLAHNVLYVSSGINFAFHLPVHNGQFATTKISHLIRPYDTITDFCVDDNYQTMWCVGNNGLFLKF